MLHADGADPDLVSMADGAHDAGAEVVRLGPAAALARELVGGVDAVVIGSRIRASQPEPSVVSLLRAWGRSGSDPWLGGMPVSAFVVTDGPDDGAEAGLQSIYASRQHAGAIIVPAGPPVGEPPPDGAANPYGTSAVEPAPGPGTVREAHDQMRGLVEVAGSLSQPVSA